MKRVKALRRAPKRLRKQAASSVSTSHARANFAGALELAQAKNAILGFERYGKSVAALVPVDAVRMLAGEPVDRSTQDEIVEGARAFVRNLPVELAPAKRAAKKKTASVRRKRKSVGKGV